MSTDPIHGSTILVTGATGQVGWGIARAAVAAGAHVVLPVRSEAAREKLGNELEGPNVLVVACDLDDDASVIDLRERALGRFGRLDHIAAPLGGWWQKGASLEQPSSELRELLSVYVEAQLRLAKTCAPALRVSGGSYSLFSGAAGEGLVPNAGLLVTAVLAQYALSRVLRRELVSEPFRFNEVRIACRIERDARPGVVTSDEAAKAFLDVMRADHRGEVLRYDGRSVAPMSTA